jgi:hypothetical protein
VSSTLADLARRVARLRPDWQDPERFFMARAELAAELDRHVRALGVAGGASGRCSTGPALRRGDAVQPHAAGPEPERLRRLVALARAQAEELAKLRRLLALAMLRLRPMRDRQLDPRQCSMGPLWSGD